MKHIILTGFMGSGKTSVGIRLSYRLRRAFVDTDRLIEREQGKAISDIFAQDGEEVFRKMETQMLRKLAGLKETQIISTGGGLPVRAENRPLLKALGTVVYLKVSPETVYERLRDDTSRPLLQCADPLSRIRELLAAREGAYREGADVTVAVDGKSFDVILEEIEEKTK